MKRLIALLLSLALSLPTLSAQTTSTERFSLMAWDDVENEDTIAKMAACGITSIAFVRPALLDACQKYNVGAIVFDERISGARWNVPFNAASVVKGIEEVAAEVGDHPAVEGYHIRDEPGAAEFPELAKAVAAVKRVAPGKWPYINLLPGDGPAYHDYVSQFIEICKPTVLSYDRYVVAGNNTFGDVFWTNIALIREEALKNNLPYQNIVLTSPHWSYKDITETDIRMQVYGSLVYGVSGLGYYKFRSRELNVLEAPALGNFHSGPLDQFDEKTETWYWLRNINRQIKNLESVLLKLKSDDVYHTGFVPELNHGITSDTLVASVPMGAYAIGDFTHEDGSRYTMLVNKSMTEPVNCNPTFNNRPKAVSRVDHVTGEIEPYEGQYYWLNPGQGVLLKLEY